MRLTILSAPPIDTSQVAYNTGLRPPSQCFSSVLGRRRIPCLCCVRVLFTNLYFPLESTSIAASAPASIFFMRWGEAALHRQPLHLPLLVVALRVGGLRPLRAWDTSGSSARSTPFLWTLLVVALAVCGLDPFPRTHLMVVLGVALDPSSFGLCR